MQFDVVDDVHSEREREREEKVKAPRDLQKEKEMEEELRDRKKAEKKAREKEAAYQERLRNWEVRERRRAKEYEREKEKELEKEEEREKEAKRLKEVRFVDVVVVDIAKCPFAMISMVVFTVFGGLRWRKRRSKILQRPWTTATIGRTRSWSWSRRQG